MQVSIWYVGIIVYIEHFNLLINFEISNKKIFLSLMYFDTFFLFMNMMQYRILPK